MKRVVLVLVILFLLCCCCSPVVQQGCCPLVTSFALKVCYEDTEDSKQIEISQAHNGLNKSTLDEAKIHLQTNM